MAEIIRVALLPFSVWLMLLLLIWVVHNPVVSERSLFKLLSSKSNRSPTVTLPKKWQKWSIGIYIGVSPFDFVSPENVENPVLTCEHVSDVPADFVADPFMLRVGPTWYMFFEVMSHKTSRGEIGFATSENGIKWTYQQIVLAEPFHLSYPYVFGWMNDYYMIPETHEAGSIRLYKALQFPVKWSHVGTLVSGPRFSDSSIVRHADKWWLFTETDLKMNFDTIRLYYADDLMGPWYEHPQSPIVDGNPRIARPAGRLLVLNNKIIRYAQDCYPTYGMQVRAFEIAELTTAKYCEREVGRGSIITGSGVGWNSDGMHHIDAHLMEDGRWIACVDGWVWVNVKDRDRAEFRNYGGEG
jgi:hypothetical protein